MGLLDSLLGGLEGQGNTTTGSSPLQSLLGSLLGGGTQGSTGVGAGMVGAGAGGLLAAAGGLPGLVSMFENAGLGNVVQSWIGNGQNQSVTPGQLGNVFGPGQIESMAAQAGLNPQELLTQLSQHLPGLIDKLTPNGHV